MSQLALLFKAPQTMAIESQPIPDPGNGHVQVRVEAAAFNPADAKIYDVPQYTNAFVRKFPTVLGFDAAGQVTKLGPDVTKFKVGDRVTFIRFPGGASNEERGAFQQYVLTNVKTITKIPVNAEYDAASTFPAAGFTAAEALYDQLKFTEPWLDAEGAYKGEKIVILGGSSSVGSYAIQFAALSGFEVITTSSPAHFEYLKSLGATAVIDRSSPDGVAEILAAAGGPVKYVIDAVALPDTLLQAIAILQPQGTLVPMQQLEAASKGAADAKGITVLGKWGSENRYSNERFWDALEGFLERGVLKFTRPTVLAGGLRAWEEAFALHREGKVSGTKIVIRPQETK
ncbi:chaperonin 10-like protein [Mycena vulgaris]|nr:chaperonin 10-like protein [Mycena vulgaris]